MYVVLLSRVLGCIFVCLFLTSNYLKALLCHLAISLPRSLPTSHNLSAPSFHVFLSSYTIHILSTHTQERWVREWLCLCATNDLVCYDEEAKLFFMNAVQTACLTNEKESPAFLGGMGTFLMTLPTAMKKNEECFRSGMGLKYDDMDDHMAEQVASLTGTFLRNHLVRGIKGIPDLAEKLEAGGRVAEFGCGTGEGSLVLANAFPKVEVHGYDISENALRLAGEALYTAPSEVASRVRFHNATLGGEHAFPSDSSCDFVLCNDVIHDLTHPSSIVSSIFSSLKEGGVWIACEPYALPTMHDNLTKLTKARTGLAYGFSLNVCMLSGASEPDGAALGTLGLSEDVMRGYCEAAGFETLEMLPGKGWGDSTMAVFVARKGKRASL